MFCIIVVFISTQKILTRYYIAKDMDVVNEKTLCKHISFVYYKDTKERLLKIRTKF